MNVKEILDKLPQTWQELKLKDFIKLTEINIIEQNDFSVPVSGIENSYQVLSVLSGISVDELEGLPMSTVAPLLNKISFVFNSNPDIKAKSSIAWKSFEEITFNDFINFQIFQKEPFKNLHLIIKAYMKQEMKDEEILELGVEDVMSAFFLLQKQTKRFLQTTKKSLQAKLRKQKMKELISFRKK